MGNSNVKPISGAVSRGTGGVTRREVQGYCPTCPFQESNAKSSSRLAMADESPSATAFVRGTVTVPPDFMLEDPLENIRAATSSDNDTGIMPTPAQYITYRPDRPNNVSKAILDSV